MPTELAPLEIADLTLYALGAAVLVLGLIYLAASRRLAPALCLPTPPPNRLEALDVLLALSAVLLLPGLIDALFSLIAPDMPTTSAPTSHSATTAPAEPAIPRARQVLALTIGQLAAIAVLIAIARARFDAGLSGWGLSLRRFGTRLAQALLACLVAWPLCALLHWLMIVAIEHFSPGTPIHEHDTVRLLLSPETPRWLAALAFFNALVLAAVTEELFFRGMLLPGLARHTQTPWPAILVSAAAFGAMHYQLAQTIPALTLFGLILGWLYARTGSLTLVILTHAIFNAKTLLWLALGATPAH